MINFFSPCWCPAVYRWCPLYFFHPCPCLTRKWKQKNNVLAKSSAPWQLEEDRWRWWRRNNWRGGPDRCPVRPSAAEQWHSRSPSDPLLSIPSSQTAPSDALSDSPAAEGPALDLLSPINTFVYSFNLDRWTNNGPISSVHKFNNLIIIITLKHISWV